MEDGMSNWLGPIGVPETELPKAQGSSWAGSILTPETELLKAQRRAIDTDLADMERLAGAAIQESREEMRKWRRQAMDRLGSWGGSSTDFYNYLSGPEAQAKSEENRISQEVMMAQANAARVRRQLDEIIPIRRAQEIYQSGKDMVESFLRGDVMGGLPDVSAYSTAQGIRDEGRYGSPAVTGGKPATGMYTEQAVRPALGPAAAAGEQAGNLARIDRLLALLQMNPGDPEILAQLAQLGVVP
jgi:hypothetical protein